MSTKRYGIYCDTEAHLVETGWVSDPPTECPNNPAHEVEEDSVYVLEEQALCGFHGQAEDEQDTTSSDWVDALVVDTGQQETGVWRCSFYSEMYCDSTSTTIECRVYNASDDVVMASVRYTQTDSLDVLPFGGASPFTLTSPTEGKTIKIQFRRAAGFGTASIRRCRVCALRVLRI